MPESDNPLLQIQFPAPFDRIRAEHVEPAAPELRADGRARLEALGSGPAARPLTFDATLMELDAMTERLDYAISVVRHLESVATYPELRAAYNPLQPQVSPFYSCIPLHPALCNPLNPYPPIHDAPPRTRTP